MNATQKVLVFGVAAFLIVVSLVSVNDGDRPQVTGGTVMDVDEEAPTEELNSSADDGPVEEEHGCGGHCGEGK
ncbi:hypothetical protein GF367_04835 [Candidatus Woesearchaeota archaeon]|nr:hypothetical protein [Candidatus Woesearchaeota archaeon]